MRHFTADDLDKMVLAHLDAPPAGKSQRQSMLPRLREAMQRRHKTPRMVMAPGKEPKNGPVRR